MQSISKAIFTGSENKKMTMPGVELCVVLECSSVHKATPNLLTLESLDS